MRIDPQTFVALLCVALAVAMLARRLTVWLRSGGQSGCGSCGSCAANSQGPARGLVSLTDFAAADFLTHDRPSHDGTTNRHAADNTASTPA